MDGWMDWLIGWLIDFISFHFSSVQFSSVSIQFQSISFHFISFHFSSVQFSSFHFISFHFIGSFIHSVSQSVQSVRPKVFEITGCARKKQKNNKQKNNKKTNEGADREFSYVVVMNSFHMTLFIDILRCFSLAAAVGPLSAAMRQMPPVHLRQTAILSGLPQSSKIILKSP